MNRLIDLDRIQRRLDDLWEIGKTNEGGVSRLAYSDEETEAIEYVLGELPDAYHVREDPIGNIFASRYPEKDRSVFVGSHLDSVFNGGRLDGTLGVVAGLEAIEAVHASDKTPWLPPSLAIFRGEESARFGQHTIGSRGALGLLTTESLSATDQNDEPLWRAMQRAGFQPSDLSEPTLDLERVAGFYELHIEQGRVLEEAGDNVGIVTSIRAPVRFRITVIGESDHSGATPMGLRSDALAGAAQMITMIETVGEDASTSGDVVATVGEITAHDGAINKVCGKVTFSVDIRSNDSTYRDEFESRVIEKLETIADKRALSLTIESIDRSNPVRLNDDMIEALACAAETAEVSYQRMPSGGGHDAMNFQLTNIPAGMTFVPSLRGVSHNPQEATEDEAIHDATEVMARAIVRGPP